MLYGIVLFLIGVTQVLGAIIRLVITRRQDSTYAIRLKQYLLFVIAFFTAFYFLIEVGINDLFVLSYIYTIPPFFAVWYWRHTRKWNKKHKRIKEFDKIQKAKNNPSLLLEVPCQERLELNNTQISMVDLSNWNSDLRVAQ